MRAAKREILLTNEEDIYVKKEKVKLWFETNDEHENKPGVIVGFGSCWEASLHLGEVQVGRQVGHQVGKNLARWKVCPSRLSKTGGGFLPDCT